MEAVTQSTALTDEEKRSFLKSIYKNYGRTALCLSGGAGFGYYHLGVVRALLQAGVLPTVITGTSAGALLGMDGASTVWNFRGAAPFQMTNFSHVLLLSSILPPVRLPHTAVHFIADHSRINLLPH